MKKLKGKSAPNFKNYVEYIKLWRWNTNEKEGVSKFCKYDRRNTYIENTDELGKENENGGIISKRRKLYFWLIIAGAFSNFCSPSYLFYN